IWGCQARFRLLGLAVMPLAAVLFALAHAAGGTKTGAASHYSTQFLVLHVGLVSLAFAGFTLAAALSGLYLWQERRLKRHSTSLCRPSRSASPPASSGCTAAEAPSTC